MEFFAVALRKWSIPTQLQLLVGVNAAFLLVVCAYLACSLRAQLPALHARDLKLSRRSVVDELYGRNKEWRHDALRSLQSGNLDELDEITSAYSDRSAPPRARTRALLRYDPARVGANARTPLLGRATLRSDEQDETDDMDEAREMQRMARRSRSSSPPRAPVITSARLEALRSARAARSSPLGSPQRLMPTTIDSQRAAPPSRAANRIRLFETTPQDAFPPATAMSNRPGSGRFGAAWSNPMAMLEAGMTSPMRSPLGTPQGNLGPGRTLPPPPPPVTSVDVRLAVADAAKEAAEAAAAAKADRPSKGGGSWRGPSGGVLGSWRAPTSLRSCSRSCSILKSTHGSTPGAAAASGAAGTNPVRLWPTGRPRALPATASDEPAPAGGDVAETFRSKRKLTFGPAVEAGPGPAPAAAAPSPPAVEVGAAPAPAAMEVGAAPAPTAVEVGAPSMAPSMAPAAVGPSASPAIAQYELHAPGVARPAVAPAAAPATALDVVPAPAAVEAKPLTMKEKIAAMQKGNGDTGAPAPKRGPGGRLRKVKTGGIASAVAPTATIAAVAEAAPGDEVDMHMPEAHATAAADLQQEEALAAGEETISKSPPPTRSFHASGERASRVSIVAPPGVANAMPPAMASMGPAVAPTMAPVSVPSAAPAASVVPSEGLSKEVSSMMEEAGGSAIASQPSSSALTFEISDQKIGIALREESGEDTEWCLIDDLEDGSQAAALGVPRGGTIVSVNGEAAATTKAELTAQLERASRPTTLLVEPPSLDA